MRWTKTITMVEAHAEGEVGRVVTGGVLDLPRRPVYDELYETYRSLYPATRDAAHALARIQEGGAG